MFPEAIMSHTISECQIQNEQNEQELVCNPFYQQDKEEDISKLLGDTTSKMLLVSCSDWPTCCICPFIREVREVAALSFAERIGLLVGLMAMT